MENLVNNNDLKHKKEVKFYQGLVSSNASSQVKESRSIDL